MRRYRNPKNFILLSFLAVSILLVVPLLRALSGLVWPSLRSAGERLALVFAYSDMPVQSLELLQARFHSEVFFEDEPDTTPIKNPNPSPSSTPAPPAAEQSGGEKAAAAPSPSTAPALKSKAEPPAIPAQYRGSMIEEDLSGYESSGYLSLEPGYLRNYTELSYAEIRKALDGKPNIDLGGSDEPQVLIYHTHATEAFESYDAEFYDKRNSWRSTDNNINMAAVGEELANTLRENGINVLHDTTQHDYPSYNGSYERSAKTVQQYLDEYPSIKVIFDVHRDAIDRDGTLVRPVVTIDGEKAAQLMIIAGCDDGTMDMPNWKNNLRFAAAIQRQTEADYPHLLRPIFFCYRKYNLDMLNGSLLLEFGSHGNTLEECLVTARLAGRSIAQVLKDMP